MIDQRWRNIALFCIGGVFSLLLLAGLSYGLATPVYALGPIFVDDDICPGTGSGTQLDPYCAIQDAVDAADPGDEIRVAEGTYGPGQMVIDARTGYTYTQVVFITKTLTLRGGYDATDWAVAPDPDAHPTVIDAAQQGRGVSIVGTSGDRPAVVIEGFTITGGDYTGLGNPTGIYNHVCFDYEADCGGGVFAQYSALTVRHCFIHDNTAGTPDDGKGGGLYLWNIAASGVLIDATTVISNSGQDQGGGLYGFGSTGLITITHSTFRANSADYGGAMLIYGRAPLHISDSDFISNTATNQTGGVHFDASSNVTMERVRFQDNQANGEQAALYFNADTSSAHLQLTNVIFSGNRTTTSYNDDAVVYVYNSKTAMQVDLLHVTAADNTTSNFLNAKSWGAGHYLTVALTNTLLVDIPTAFAASETSDGTTLIRHTHTLTDGVTTLHTTLEGTPTFEALNPVSGDARLDATYHLLSDSDAIDAGVDAGVLDDIDGDTRPLGTAPDIGADELDPTAPTGVSITGPDTVAAYAVTDFTANVSPVTATAPFTYVWQATGLSPVTHTGQGSSDTASFAWSSIGAKTITVTASNVAGTVIDTHVVDVVAVPAFTIVKSGPAEATEGTPFTYTLTVTNTGLAAASNLVITDVLPIEASYVSGGTYDPVEHAVTWTMPNLAANGGVAQVTFAVTATQTLTNSDYSVSADGGYEAVGTEPVVTIVRAPWIRYVAPGGTDSGNICANSPSPCATVQHAVDVANPGDEIRVAEGTYGPGQLVIDTRTSYTYTQVVFITKTLTLRGGYDATDWAANPDPDAHPTVIDAEQQGRGVSIVGTSGDRPSVVIEGFTITGGDYTGLGNPTGTYNRVCRNYETDCGGGLFAQYSALTVRNCYIHDNTAGTPDNGEGGGLYLWNAVASGVLIDATTVISNSGQRYGGGLYDFGSTGPITITHSIFRGNSASYGGAMLVNGHALLHISDSDFISNTATIQTGGVHFDAFANVTMERVRFQNNQAYSDYAALHLDADTSDAHVRLTNVLFSGNRTTATANNTDDAVVYIYNSKTAMQVDMLHVTAADNTTFNFLNAKSWGSGHYLTVALTNTLLVDIPAAFAASETNDGTALIHHTHTLTDGVTTLHTTLEGTPTFEALNPISGDASLDATYHLLSDSDAIDAGIDAEIPDDIDGDVRPQGSTPDIGADELNPTAPIGVSITGPDTVAAYAVTDFTANVSPVTATAPFTYVWQATGLSPVTHTGQGSSDTASFAWSSTGTKTITVTASNAMGTVTDTHTVSVIGAPILAITKSGPAEVVEGTAFTYTLTIANTGLAAASNLVITDVLPAGAIYVSGGSYDAGTHTVSWSVASLAQGSTAQVTCAVAATQTVTNATYGATADGGYEAVGTEPVVTVVRAPWIRYVAPGGTDGSNTCFDNTAPCATMQHAVDVANPGDEIRVAEGTYGSPQTVVDARTGYTYTQVAFITKTLTLRGGYTTMDWDVAPDPTAHPTVLDAAQQGRGVTVMGADGDEPDVVIDGFTITGGDYTGLGNPAATSGQTCPASGDCAGGLLARWAKLVLQNSVVEDNMASRADSDRTSYGGGVYLWSPMAGSRIENTAIISNSVAGGNSQGGGLYLRNSEAFTLTGCTLERNRANDGGGGMAIQQPYGPVIIEDSEFLENSTGYLNYGGGALYAFVTNYDGEVLWVNRVRMSGNEARDRGAAIYLRKLGDSNASARLTNLILSGNRATVNHDNAAVIAIAPWNASDVTLAHVTAADNLVQTFLYAESDSGVGDQTTVVLTNTLVVSFTSAFVAAPQGSGAVTIQHDHTFTDNVGTLHYALSGTPTFIATHGLSGNSGLDANCHLLADSDAIDAAVDAGVPDDIDGDVRPQGNAPDIGADESSYTGPGGYYIYLPLVMRNK